MRRFIILVMCFLMSFPMSTLAYGVDWGQQSPAYTSALTYEDAYKDNKKMCDEETLKCRKEGIYSDEYRKASRRNKVYSAFTLVCTAAGLFNLGVFQNIYRLMRRD